MRSLFAVLRSLLLPAGAPPTSPAIFIGTDPIPAELVTFYAAETPNPATVIAVITYRKDTSNYVYDGLIHIPAAVPAQIWRVVGSYKSGPGVFEDFRIGLGDGSGLMLFGARTGGVTAEWSGGLVFIGGGSEIRVENGAMVTVNPDGEINIGLGAVFTVDGFSTVRGYSPASYRTNNGTVCTTPAGGAETAVPSANWDSEPNLLWRSGGLWVVRVAGAVVESTGGGGAVSFIRVRKGQATTTGTQLALIEVFHPVGFGGLTGSFEFHFLVKNTSGSDVTSRLSMTVNGVIGGGTWSLYGDGNRQLSMDIEEIGDASDHADLANLAVSM